MTAPFPSAEVFARAIVAAAGAWDDNPVAACSAVGTGRRALSAAGVAVAKITGVTASRVGRLLKVDPATLCRAGSPKASDAVKAAIRRAEIAAAKAWRAQAAKAWRPPSTPAPPPQARLTVLAAGAVQRRVLAHLMEAPATAPELAAAIGVADAQVRQALSDLAEAATVQADPITQEGWRSQTWRAVGGDR